MPQKAEPVALSEAAVVTRAALRAATHLGLSNKALADVIGVSEATVSRMRNGSHVVAADGKPFELSVLFVRLFRSLDAIVGGDHAVAADWLKNENLALHAVPLDLIRTIAGLVDVVAYLDARRVTV